MSRCLPDSKRWFVGLQPFPRAVPPPAPPTEERTQEILADPRVQAVRERDAAARGEKQQSEEQQQGVEEEQVAEQQKEEQKELVGANA
jgi:hypothetical protein